MTLQVNHHGDGRLALNLAAPDGAQALYVEGQPEHYFVPAYVGHKGWLGLDLLSGLAWDQVCHHIREAYETVASAKLTAQIGTAPQVAAPKKLPTLEELDPMRGAQAQRKLAKLRKICLALPETAEAEQFGQPSFRAGKKGFCTAYHRKQRLKFSFWVGAERQSALIDDPRYEVPAYTGHNGWIELDLQDHIDMEEIQLLSVDSYRHFALKRMLKALEEAG